MSRALTTTPLPMPARLDPKVSRYTLMMSVRTYFYALYNIVDDTFRSRLASVRNADAVTENRMFDRYEAVNLIRQAAKKADDAVVMAATAGKIYQCVTKIMRDNGLGLKLRRAQYDRLTHQAAE